MEHQKSKENSIILMTAYLSEKIQMMLEIMAHLINCGKIQKNILDFLNYCTILRSKLENVEK